MRILHFADLHIGVENYGRTDPATGLSTRLQDFLAALDELVDYALGNEIDLVLFAGDAYKSRDPSQTQQREFARRIVRLTSGGVPVFLLVGNHDLPYAAGRATAVEIFPILGVPGVTVGSGLGTYVVETRTGGPLQIVAVPWITRSWLLTQDEYRTMASRSLNEVMEQKLGDLLAVEYAKLDASLPAVLAGHLAGTWAVPGSERRMTIGADPVFLPSTLTGSSAALERAGVVEYGALGHVHQQQVYDGRFPLVYSGSLQRVDFGEEGQEKGFYVIDIDPALPAGDRLRSYDFVPVRSRTFLTIEVRCRTANPTEEVLNAIDRKAREVQGAIVRVQVSLPVEHASSLDEQAVRRALAGASYVAGVTREVAGAPRTRLQDVQVEGLTPLQALELYFKAKETTPERARVLMQHAQRLLSPDASKESA